jgi:hypothetical protein
MNNRPTPDTDERAVPHIGFYSCATVPAEFARKLERERDEARGALMKIEDLFVDGTDVYADREKMGMIARNALEGAK